MRTKLDVRVEKHITEGGVEQLLLRTSETEKGQWRYLEPKQQLRKEVVRSDYKAMISDDLSETLARMDKHRAGNIVTRMLQIGERPTERGQTKHGQLAGIKGLKFEGKSYVLLYSIAKSEEVVLFYGYYHHDIAYDAKTILPLIAKMRFTPFEQWIADWKR